MKSGLDFFVSDDGLRRPDKRIDFANNSVESPKHDEGNFHGIVVSVVWWSVTSFLLMISVCLLMRCVVVSVALFHLSCNGVKGLESYFFLIFAYFCLTLLVFVNKYFL